MTLPPSTNILDTYQSLLTTFSDFLTVAIHTILYERAIYPPSTFISTRKYNFPVRQNRHPRVCRLVRRGEVIALGVIWVVLRAYPCDLSKRVPLYWKRGSKKGELSKMISDEISRLESTWTLEGTVQSKEIRSDTYIWDG